MKTFCIAGPIIPEDHYYIPRRLDWCELNTIIENKFYFCFMLHVKVVRLALLENMSNISITKAVIERAKNELIMRRDTHIDALLDRLHEDRVRVIIDTIINGYVITPSFSDDDIQYVEDLGLISSKSQGLDIANPIYKRNYSSNTCLQIPKKYYSRNGLV
jgi:hypothetical protein